MEKYRYVYSKFDASNTFETSRNRGNKSAMFEINPDLLFSLAKMRFHNIKR